MRFNADGPIIPDSLLRERDAGRVVFLCGAGVSVPAGMPTFVQLTELVMKDLAPAEETDIVQAFEPWINVDSIILTRARTSLDQIFNMLQQEYGKDEVGKLVTKHLGIDEPTSIDTSQHKIIARISSNHEGIPQIVTTNFDHFFEYTFDGDQIGYYEPPSFPDLRHGVPLTGITYLHGRLAGKGAVSHDYVLSSSDFGRAYLAEGWATSFIRSLLEKYTVVLLGYQAEDPPVKYLLQGLSSVRSRDQHPLYAFDRGQADEVEAKWQDRGVVPIAYGEDHELLWDTLEAWAGRSDDPRRWTSSILSMAQRGPEALEAHERGMVCHVIQTSSGAKLFADVEPIHPAEWLCVFDKNCRSVKKISSHVPGEGEFDASEAFGLDDEPHWEEERARQQESVREDLISWRRGDDSSAAIHRLSGTFLQGHEPMPARLFHLARWMAKGADQPTLAWWVARQPGLHPRLLALLTSRIEDAEGLPETARILWHIILDSVAIPYDVHNQSWFHLRRRIKRSGWTSSVLRAFQKASEPTFKIKSPSGIARAKPPPKSWTDTEWRQIVEIDIEFSDMFRNKVDVPDEVLPEVFAILQWNLVRTVDRLLECQKDWFRIKSLNQKNENGQGYVSKADAFVICFVSLLDRMSEINPTLLKGHINTWPQSEGYFFDKLRLYALNKPKLFSSQDVATYVLSMDSTKLWHPGDKQEVLFLIRDRWSGFNAEERARIAGRILDGRPQYPREETEQYELHRNEEAAVRLGWLVQEGCEMPASSLERWNEIKRQIPGWRDAWAESAARIPEGRVGWVRTSEDAAVFEGVPISAIIEVAEKNTGRAMMEGIERRPFVGLVKERPSRAIAALSVASRRGGHPVRFWSDIINHWPTTASNRACRFFCERVRRLPLDVIPELSSEIGTWLEERLSGIAEIDEKYAFELYDDLLTGLLAGGERTTGSALMTIRVGGVETGPSGCTINHAINSPVGKATKAMLSMLAIRDLPAGRGMPIEFSSRFNRLLDAADDGKGHAACLLAERIDWLNHIAPSWVKGKMVPWFELGHPRCEPAWNGVFSCGVLPSASVFDQIKDDFIQIFPKLYAWKWQDIAEESAHSWVVLASIFSDNELLGISFEDARGCIRRMTQEGQRQVIGFLGRVGQDNEDGWKTYVIPFIESAWPKEARYQTERTTQAWMLMLEETDVKFPDVLDVVKPFLRPMRTIHYGLYGIADGYGGQESIISKFPEHSLDLLDLVIAEEPGNAPFDLDQTLQLLVEARPGVVSDRRFARLHDLASRQ